MRDYYDPTHYCPQSTHLDVYTNWIHFANNYFEINYPEVEWLEIVQNKSEYPYHHVGHKGNSTFMYQNDCRYINKPENISTNRKHDCRFYDNHLKYCLNKKKIAGYCYCSCESGDGTQFRNSCHNVFTKSDLTILDETKKNYEFRKGMRSLISANKSSKEDKKQTKGLIFDNVLNSAKDFSKNNKISDFGRHSSFQQMRDIYSNKSAFYRSAATSNHHNKKSVGRAVGKFGKTECLERSSTVVMTSQMKKDHEKLLHRLLHSSSFDVVDSFERLVSKIANTDLEEVARYFTIFLEEWPSVCISLYIYSTLYDNLP